MTKQARREFVAQQQREPVSSELPVLAPKAHVSVPHRVEFFDTANTRLTPSEDIGEPGTVLRMGAVSCGAEFSVVLSHSRKEVWCFGRGNEGQLGQGRAVPSSVTPLCALPKVNIPRTPTRQSMAADGKIIDHYDDDDDDDVVMISREYLSISCGPTQVALTASDGSVVFWGSGIIPNFAAFFNQLKVESGEGMFLQRKGKAQFRDKGARVVYEHTDDASKEREDQIPFSKQLYHVHVQEEAGFVPPTAASKRPETMLLLKEHTRVFEIGREARARGHWLSKDDRDNYRRVVRESQLMTQEAKLKWLYLGGGPMSRFVDSYKGGGVYDECFIPLEPQPDRADPDRPADSDVVVTWTPAVVLNAQELGVADVPFIRHVVLGSRFALAIVAGPDPAHSSVTTAMTLSDEEYDKLQLEEHDTAEAEHRKDFASFNRRRLTPGYVLEGGTGDDVVIEIEVRVWMLA